MAERTHRFRVREGKLIPRSAKDPVVDATVDGATLEERKRFGCFAEEDARLLAELQPTIDRHARSFVDRFYEHLLATPPLRPFLGARPSNGPDKQVLVVAEVGHQLFGSDAA